MDNFKIEHFKKDNPSKEFPWFKTLSFKEATAVFSEISRRIGTNIDRTQLVIKIDELGKSISSFNANSKRFSLKEVCEMMDISPKKMIFINWYRFDDIDKMYFEDLNTFFDDIWYPSSDDIDIFDENFSWILSISHIGNIKIVKIEGLTS